MKIYDISQELFSCVVFPGDLPPSFEEAKRTERGDICNVTNISLCAHNGTHLDAPFHFLGDGKTVEQIPLEKTVGNCYVASFEGHLGALDAEKILSNAKKADLESARRILLKGNATVTCEAAEVFAKEGIYLIGVESQSVGAEDAPVEVHKILLKREVVLLEGVRLGEVWDGVYFLNAAPISLAGADGAPCRAILISND